MSLPLELWAVIIKYLPVKDLKSLTLLSRDFYILAGRKLWHSPAFRSDLLNLEKFKQISHLPIVKLRIGDLEIGRLQESEIRKFFIVMRKMRFLKALTTKGNRWNHLALKKFFSELKKSKLKVGLDLCIGEFELPKCSDDTELQDFMQIISVESIKRLSIKCDTYWFFNIVQLRYLATFPITDLDIAAFDIPVTDYDTFVRVLGDMKLLKNLFVSNMCHLRRTSTLLNITELSKLQGLPLRKVNISALNLTFGNLEEFVQTLLTFETLKDVIVTEIRDGWLDCAELRILSRLPVTEVFTNALNLNSENLLEFITIFRQMQFLEKIVLVQPSDRFDDSQDDDDFLFKSHELVLLSELPVKFTIYSSALNITKKNFKDLVNVLATLQLDVFFTDHHLLGNDLGPSYGTPNSTFYTKVNYRRQLLEKKNIPFSYPTHDFAEEFRCPECDYCGSDTSVEYESDDTDSDAELFYIF